MSESIIEYRDFLKRVQDVLSTLSMLPIKIYDHNGEPLTSWSNPTFLHWMTDMVDFDYLTSRCPESIEKCLEKNKIFRRAVDFYGLAKWLSRETKRKVKKFIDLENPSKGDNKTPSDGFIHFLNENGPVLKIVPIQWNEELKFYVVVGGVWLARDRDEVDSLKQKFAYSLSLPMEMTFTEKRVVFNEVEDLPWISRDDFARRCVRLKRAFRLLRHYRIVQKPLLNNIMGVYRISEFRDAWRKYAEKIFDISSNISSASVKKVFIAMTPIYKDDPFIKGYLWFFDRELAEIREAELDEMLDELFPSTDIYFLVSRYDIDGFLNANLKSIKLALEKAYKEFGKKPFEPLNFFYEIDEYEFNEKVKSLLHYEKGNVAIRLFVYLNKPPGKILKNRIKNTLKTIIGLMMEEFKDILEKTQRSRTIAENYFINVSMKLVSSIAGYLKLSDSQYTCDLIRSIKNTFPYIEEIKCLRPRFYEGDRQFEVYCPLSAGDTRESEEIPEKIFKSLFSTADLKTLVSGKTSYEPVAAGHRVFSVMKFKHGNTWPEGVVERIGQRLSAVLTQRVPYRRFVHIVNKLREKLISYEFKGAIRDMSEDFLSSVAEEIAMGFTAHACTIWLYDDSEEAFYRKGAAGQLGDLLKKNKLNYDPYNNLISLAWNKWGEYIERDNKSSQNGKERLIIKLPADMKMNALAFGDDLIELGFNKGAAVAWRSAPDFGVVITLWSKLGEAWNLDEDDANRLREIAHLISDSLKVKYDLYMLDIRIDEALTSIIHELKSPLVGIKDGAEYIAELAAETLAPALIKLEPVKDNSTRSEHEQKEIFVYSLRKFQKSIRESFSELTKKIFYNTKETLEVTQKNMLQSFEYIWELIRFMTLYTSYKELDFSTGKLLQLKFWSDVVNDVVKRSLYWRFEGKALKLHFEFDSTFPEWVYMPKPALDALKIIIFNLVANAIKYSYHGTTIKMKGYIRNSFVVVEIQNQGIGVPEGEEKLIFEKWTRGSNASTVSAQGTGLGLFLSRELARKIGGDLKLTRNADPTIFELTIPLKYFADFNRGGNNE